VTYDRGIPTHYDVLGVAPDAPAPVIREAYRALARQHHPDRVAAAEGPSPAAPDHGMARINEAYRVLGDPGRRAVYDRSLAGGSVPRAGSDDVDRAETATIIDEAPGRPTALDPSGPARVPWKLMLVAGLVGSVLVLISAALADSPADEVPDGIIRTDSCVTIEPNGDAREVACTGEDDIVVELLLPTEAECPVGLEAHRDRLGLGIACIRP
jgi:molecular chaperone DnaJ